MEFKSNVIFTGRVPDAQLYQLTAAAFCSTYVSYFEGWSYHREAMRCGVPIIASNITAVPEVAGTAAFMLTL